MGDENSNILKRKMAASGRDPGPLHLIADLSARMGKEAAGAFGEYYGEKCQLGETQAPHFARLDEALAPHACKAGIYQFRIGADKDFIIVLDVETSMRAAGWSLAGSRDLPDPLPETVSPIDRRLAKRLAVRSAEMIFAKADNSGVIKGAAELIASGDEPRRFDFTDDKQRIVGATFSIQTLESEVLGSVTIYAAERITLAMREYYEKAVPAAEIKWKRDLRKLAAMSPTTLRADLAEQEITLGMLMGLQPGQVIDLTSASIDDVSVLPDAKCASGLKMTGSLGNRDGVRALRVKSIDY
ncbi:FliM/FliN family flagellar motor C-terminal domain-containing protein [Hyphococcus sp.]|uniref:FliM/FliN family flagellar motor C-terminal domain-containing protein n=1 Tax=Hyphococcus sp. TaxID=2038636 RepID=UPI002082C221|nr:MAG: hypothetical protein DHS20C04_02420 [Marinicaulis sp.]